MSAKANFLSLIFQIRRDLDSVNKEIKRELDLEQQSKLPIVNPSRTESNLPTQLNEVELKRKVLFLHRSVCSRIDSSPPAGRGSIGRGS